MSSNNVAHVASVDKGLKMKIKRTKGTNKVDSKHEVVKTDTQAKQTLPSGQSSASLAAAMLASTSASSPSVASTVTSGGGSGNSTTFMLAASVASSLLSSASITPSSSASSSAVVSSLVTNVTSNPTVALLKAVSAGIISDVYSGANIGATNKSPLKNVPCGVLGLDQKDGRSPKTTKAAYSKKAKDNKGKPDIMIAVASASNECGLNQLNTDSRISVTVSSNGQTLGPAILSLASHAGIINSTVASEPRPGDTVHMKRENPIHDPYEFNAKVEDKIELPPKKLKLEKTDCIEISMSPQPHIQQHSSPPAMLHPPPPPPKQQQPQQQPQKRSVGIDVRSIGVVTEPDCLGPCEPGTLVGLEGIVWKETDNGLLVLNVTWRGKTYVGTLMDATRYAWAPPRPNGCDSPVSDFDSRPPKGRGKRNNRTSVQTSERLPEGRRLRKGRRGTVNSSSSNFTAPPSPAKSDISTSNLKRKAKASDVDIDKPKRSRSCSRGVTEVESPTPDGYIVCPEPNCHKKYKHMNGLRYHRTHAHRNSSLTDDEEDEEEEKSDKKEKNNLLERAEKVKAKERQRIKEQQRVSGRDSKDSLDDDIPLKEIANKASGQSIAQRVDVVSASKDRSEEESSNNSNDGTSSGIASTTLNSKVEPQVVLTKTDIPLQKEATPPATCVSASKKKDHNLLDVSVSSSSSSVPCLPTNESPQVLTANSNPSTPVTTTTKSQVFNITTTGSMAGVALITQSQPLPLMTSASDLSCATMSTSVLGVTMTTDRQNGGKSSSVVKSISSARPIVPAPSPQMASFCNPLSQSMSSLPSIQTHGSTLKHIQPKPTILGDYPVMSPTLSDLSKEKSRKPKKKKDNPETGTHCPGNPSSKHMVPSRESNISMHEMPSQDDLYKSERSAVIKSSTPSKPYDASSPSNDMSKLPFQSSVNAIKMQYSLGSDLSRVAIPPSTLAISPNADIRNTINDDVHSPAYSDISDANDSNSPIHQDSPKKDSSLKKDGHVNGPPLLGPDISSHSQHYGNMFYYGGPPSYMPHGIGPQMASPTVSDGLIKKDDMDEKRPSSSNEAPQDKKEGARCINETDLQQKTLMNYLAHLHGMSPAAVQLQYNIAGYNSAPMDSSYAMLAQQALDQQKRLPHHNEMPMKIEDASGKRTPAGTQSTNRHIGPGSGFQSSGKLNMGTDIPDGHQGQHRLSTDREQIMRDKHNDTHHIFKENIELKSHMGQNHDQHNYHTVKQQQNELLRAQMYQQQKQKIYESQRHDRRKSPPKLTATGSHSTGLISRSPSESKPHELIPHEMIKKEIIHSKDSSRLDAVDSKRFDIKEEITQPGPSSSSLDITSKSRPPSQPNTPNIPQASSASSSVSSSLPSTVASSLPISLVSSLPGTGAAFPYTPYYPHLRPMQLESMYRTLTPHIIGYASAPHGYIHPTQLGYRVPVVDTDGKPPDSVEALRGDGPTPVTGSGYAPVHKIHELHDKGRRPSPGGNSPAPNKPGSADNLNSSGSQIPGPALEKIKDKQREYSSSPPTQRHVHTHHHTHVMSGFPPLYPPDPYTMFGHPAAAAAAASIQTSPHPFPPPAPPPPAPKS